MQKSIGRVVWMQILNTSHLLKPSEIHNSVKVLEIQ